MFSSKKPYSAITVAVERLTSNDFEEDDYSGIPDLVETINLQSTGPAEAARAIRKKLKYGAVHQQVRALSILDGLIQNAGSRFQRTFADEMLLERLRVCGTSELVEPRVRAKCTVLFRSWAAAYKGIRGLEGIAGLYKQLPRRKQPVVQQQPKVKPGENPFGEEEDEPESPERKPSPPQAAASSSSHAHQNSYGSFTPLPSKKDKKKEKEEKKKKGKKFNLEAEKPLIKNCIAEASVASTNLLNSLKLINRETERVSENRDAAGHFDNCQKLQKKIQRYVYLTSDSPEFLGALLHANDELGTAIKTFIHLDSSIDADSDSEDEMAEQQHLYHVISGKGKDPETSASHQLAGLHIGSSTPKSPEQRPTPPPRPVAQTAPEPEEEEEEEDDFEEEDENDPFADRNAVTTPKVEKREPVWKTI